MPEPLVEDLSAGGRAGRTPSSLEEVARTSLRTLEAVGQVVVGQLPSLRLALAAVLAGGHVLIEDVPGTGKTLAARSLAGALGLDFRRLQCTPDLLPADVTGSFVYDPGGAKFVFHPGPVMAGLLLADEINRTPPKTQSALLEAMQEGQVTVEGRTFALPRPFHVLATANPIEYEGTYPLPEAQLDRFLLRLDFGYPGPDEEMDVVGRRLARRQEATSVDAVVDAEGLLRLQAGVEQVDVDPDVVAYAVSLARATRGHAQVEVGASPRGSLALVLVARALAVIDGRDVVLPEDVKTCATSVLAHRLTLAPETWSTGTTGSDVVRDLLDRVPTPEHASRRTVTPRWQGARSLRRAAMLCVLLPALGLVTGRADVVVLAAPLVLGTVLAMSSAARARPRGAGVAAPGASAVWHGAPTMTGQGEEVTVAVDVRLPPGGGRCGRQAAAGPGDALRGRGARGARHPRAPPAVSPSAWSLPLWGKVLVARPDVRAVGR